MPEFFDSNERAYFAATRRDNPANRKGYAYLATIQKSFLAGTPDKACLAMADKTAVDTAAWLRLLREPDDPIPTGHAALVAEWWAECVRCLKVPFQHPRYKPYKIPKKLIHAHCVKLRRDLVECLAQTGPMTPAHTLEYLTRQDPASVTVCPGCAAAYDASNPRETDHIIPLSLAGRDSLANLQYRCRRCNRERRWQMTQARRQQYAGGVDVV